MQPLHRKLEQSQEREEVKAMSASLSLSKPRSNWIQLSESTFFSGPLMNRPLTSTEIDAVHVLHETTGLYMNIPTVGSFAERLCQNGEIYHSKAYKRAGKSCSYLVQFFIGCTLSGIEYFYGKIEVFVCIGTVYVALIRQYSQVVTTITKNNINLPTDADVRAYATAGLLGSHHVCISDLPANELLAVPCDNITAKCILVEVNEPFVFAYLTPVIDIHCT